MDPQNISPERIQELITYEFKYNQLKEPRQEYNKKGYKNWRETVDEERYKEMRKLSNAKYTEKKRLEKLKAI